MDTLHNREPRPCRHFDPFASINFPGVKMEKYINTTFKSTFVDEFKYVGKTEGFSLNFTHGEK